MSEQTPQERSGGDRWWLAAAVVVALVLIGLVWVVVGGRQGADDSAPPSQASSEPSTPVESPSSTSATATGTTWPGAGCNGTTGQVMPPQQAMTDVSWQPYPALPVAAPSSPTIGPKSNDPLRRCYQHTPAGALLAAVNIEFGFASPAVHKVVAEQTTPGPGRADILSGIDESTGSVGNVAAFRLAGCSASVCNVELIYLGGGAYADAVIPMIWSDGDWKVNGSSKMPEPGLVQGIPAGFTAWGPTS